MIGSREKPLFGARSGLASIYRLAVTGKQPKNGQLDGQLNKLGVGTTPAFALLVDALRYRGNTF